MDISEAAREKLAKMVKDICGPVVKEALDAQIAKLKEGGGMPAPVAASLGDGHDAKDAKNGEVGRLAGRAVIAFASAVQSKRFANPVEGAHKIAKERWGENDPATKIFEKALSAGTESEGAALLSEEVSADVIELLRPASAVRKQNPVMAPMDNGVLRLPKLTGGASAGYIAENADAPKTQQAFGSVRATAHKLAALVPISNDLLRRKGPGVETMARDDIVAAIAQKSDITFIRSDGSNGEPKGLKSWAPAANVIDANATINAQNVVHDLGQLIQVLADGNVRFLRPGWLMSHRTWLYLLTLLDNNNNFIFREEVKAGTLFGYPIARTSQIPNNLGGGSNESEIYLVDFADVVIAEATTILLDASSEAAYNDGSAVVAAFSMDQTVIRAIVEHDLVMRHDESIAMLDQVKWALA